MRQMNKFLLTIFVSFPFFTNAASPATPHFASGYVGTIPTSPDERAKTYFDRPAVRQLLTALQNGAVTIARANTVLSKSGTHLADLERMRLITESAGKLHIAFPYFTAADMRNIHAATAKYVPSLVAAYRAHETELSAMLARYPVATVSKKRLAFVLLAGFSLNLDALDLLAREGYRQPLLITGPGWRYGFWAAEVEPNYSYRAYYWGSSSFPTDAQNLTPPVDYTFSSFGDPYSDPRMNFPDLLGLEPRQMTPPVRKIAQQLGLTDDPKLGLKNVIGLERGRDFGTILFAIREGAHMVPQICDALPLAARPDCGNELALLATTHYLKQSGQRYELIMPVLGSSDRPMMEAVLGLSRSVLKNWLA